MIRLRPATTAGRLQDAFPRSAGKHMATKAIDAPRKTTGGLIRKQRRIRKIFGNIHEISEMPNLIEVSTGRVP